MDGVFFSLFCLNSDSTACCAFIFHGKCSFRLVCRKYRWNSCETKDRRLVVELRLSSNFDVSADGYWVYVSIIKVVFQAEMWSILWWLKTSSLEQMSLREIAWNTHHVNYHLRNKFLYECFFFHSFAGCIFNHLRDYFNHFKITSFKITMIFLVFVFLKCT